MLPHNLSQKATESTTLFSVLCQNMGWTPDYLEAINDDEHQPLMHIDLLCGELESIRRNNQLIVIYPDIDTDGLTSGSLGLAGLAELGFNVRLYVPDAAKGHGVYPEDIQTIKATYPDAAAIITCDTGITSFKGVEEAHKLGLKIFVTDHHKEYLDENGQRLPADIIINPMRLDETYTHPAICGAFVLYQILEQYTTTYRPEKLDSIKMLKLHAGIGTVADVMPLTYENRAVVRDSLGLLKLLYVKHTSEYDPATRTTTITTGDVEDSILMQIIKAGDHHPIYVRTFRCIATLVNAYVARGSVRTIHSLDEGFYGFYIAPTVNSIRRTGEDIGLGFSAFLAQEPQVYSKFLIENNDRRKELVKQLIEELVEQPQPLAPYVYVTDARAGMLGLLANEMMNRSGVPTLVVRRQDSGKLGGSGRSPEWYTFNSKINQAASDLGINVSAQGHEQAFGARAESWDDLTRLQEFIKADSFNVAEELRNNGEVIDIPEADLVIGDLPECDAPLDDMESLLDLTDQLTMLKPFGHGFRKPVVDIVSAISFNLDYLPVTSKQIGSNSQHVSITNRQGVKMLKWNDSTTLPNLYEALATLEETDEPYLHAIGSIERNEFRQKDRDIISVNHMVDSFYLEVISESGERRRIPL